MITAGFLLNFATPVRQGAHFSDEFWFEIQI